LADDGILPTGRTCDSDMHKHSKEFSNIV